MTPHQMRNMLQHEVVKPLMEKIAELEKKIGQTTSPKPQKNTKD